MILSSADLKRILGGNQIIRLSATIEIVERKPALSGREGLYIYIQRYPQLTEFEAVFTLWIESDGSEPDDIVIAELRKILPKVQVKAGLLTEVTTTEFRSQSTLEAPAEAPTPQVDLSAFESRFQALVEEVQDQMLLVHSGRPGRDGADGAPGRDGADGRDLVATEADLEDLQNVEQNIAKEDGQVLTWKDGVWQNLFIPQIVGTIGGGGGGGTSGGGGVSATVQWKFVGLLNGSDPQSGTFETDNIAGDQVTTIRVSKDTNRGNDISVLIRDLLLQGYDRLYVAQTLDLSQAQLYSITGTSETAGSFILTVAHVETAGVEPNYLNGKSYEFYISQSSAGGGGSTTLVGLTDTNIQNPANLEVLQYDSATSRWINATLSYPSAPVTSVNTQTGDVVLDADDIDDSTTVNKFVTSTDISNINSALQPGDVGVTVQAYNAGTVVDPSYVHTDNNYTTAEKSKLAGIAAGAEANVNADWNAVSGDAQILNKPTLGTAAAANTTDFATASQGAKADTAVQPGSLATVATSGSYTDLTNKPTIPATLDDLTDVNTSTATGGQYLQYNGTSWVPVTGSAGGLTIDDVRLDAESQTFNYSNGSLVSVIGAEVQTVLTYNPDGTIATVTKTSNGTSVTKTFSYDGNGNLGLITVS